MRRASAAGKSSVRHIAIFAAKLCSRQPCVNGNSTSSPAPLSIHRRQMWRTNARGVLYSDGNIITAKRLLIEISWPGWFTSQEMFLFADFSPRRLPVPGHTNICNRDGWTNFLKFPKNLFVFTLIMQAPPPSPPLNWLNFAQNRNSNWNARSRERKRERTKGFFSQEEALPKARVLEWNCSVMCMVQPSQKHYRVYRGECHYLSILSGHGESRGISDICALIAMVPFSCLYSHIPVYRETKDLLNDAKQSEGETLA